MCGGAHRVKSQRNWAIAATAGLESQPYGGRLSTVPPPFCMVVARNSKLQIPNSKKASRQSGRVGPQEGLPGLGLGVWSLEFEAVARMLTPATTAASDARWATESPSSTRSLMRTNSMAKRSAPASSRYDAEDEAVRSPGGAEPGQQDGERDERDRPRTAGWGARARRSAAAPRKRHGPWQRARPSVVVADQEAADAADRVTHRQAGGRRREHGERPQSRPPHECQARSQAAGEPAEPAHAAARRQEPQQRLLASVLERPQQLGPEQPADDPGDTDVDDRVRQAGSTRFAAQQPDADEGAERDHRPEAGDVERPDAEQDGIDGGLRVVAALRRRRAAAAARWRSPTPS